MSTEPIDPMVDPIGWTCHICHLEYRSSVPEMAEHLETVHGHAAPRWPDGTVVVDMSDVPELLDDRLGEQP